MPFELELPTRHTDAFASTGYVHAGVLLALTELAYAACEQHLGIAKPEHVFAVQRATEAVYHAPLRWQEHARIRVTTVSSDERAFDQEFLVLSAVCGREVARITHHWVWLDTQSGKRVPVAPEIAEDAGGSS